jgi:hypothetical protein
VRRQQLRSMFSDPENNPYTDPSFWRPEMWGCPTRFEKCLWFANDHRLLFDRDTKRLTACLHLGIFEHVADWYTDHAPSLARFAELVDRGTTSFGYASVEYEAVISELGVRLSEGESAALPVDRGIAHDFVADSWSGDPLCASAVLNFAHAAAYLLATNECVRAGRIRPDATYADLPNVVANANNGLPELNSIIDPYYDAIHQRVTAHFWDILPNPFRPVIFDPCWRSESAVALARTAYDTRNFTLLPILADALEEAGCDHADVLAHCRDPKALHARGCWVVDLVLNKS